MLKKAVIRKFVKNHIAAHVPEFQLYKGTVLVRVCRPLLHGIVFEQSSGDDFYVTCFTQFLTIPRDYLVIGHGERIRRYDRHGQSFKPEPAEEEAAKLLDAMRRSPYSPFNLTPTCKRIIEMANEDEEGAYDFYGLATCAIFETDPGLARHFFSRAKERIGIPEYDWDTKMFAEIRELEDGLDDLAATQMELRRRVEETIRLLKLEQFA